jgi:hypothetical protein
LSWDNAQHLSELAGGEFARSTGAGDHLRQTLGHFLLTGFALEPQLVVSDFRFAGFSAPGRVTGS